MRVLVGFVVAAAVVAVGCGEGVEDTTCADVSRSSEKTEALVMAVAEEEVLPADNVHAGLVRICGEAKPDDTPYADLPRYALAEFHADVEQVRRLLGDDEGDRMLRERERLQDAQD
jgi:hypothetical protein